MLLMQPYCVYRVSFNHSVWRDDRVDMGDAGISNETERRSHSNETIKTNLHVLFSYSLLSIYSMTRPTQCVCAFCFSVSWMTMRSISNWNDMKWNEISGSNVMRGKYVEWNKTERGIQAKNWERKNFKNFKQIRVSHISDSGCERTSFEFSFCRTSAFTWQNRNAIWFCCVVCTLHLMVDMKWIEFKSEMNLRNGTSRVTSVNWRRNENKMKSAVASMDTEQL